MVLDGPCLEGRDVDVAHVGAAVGAARSANGSERAFPHRFFEFAIELLQFR